MEDQLIGSARRRARLPGRLAVIVAVSLLADCRAVTVQPATPSAGPAAPERSVIASAEAYRQTGFLVGEGAVPFVGMVRYFATESLDTTMVLLALSIPPRALSFVRAGDRYAAYYAVRIDVMSGPTLVRSERPTGEVRVASFQETTRGDEGVIFQRALRLPPGNYALHVTAQDSLGAATGTVGGPIAVPSMGDGSITPLFPVFAAQPRASRGAPLDAVANPRATVRYGKDSTVQFYVESYGEPAPDTLVITSRSDRDQSFVLRRDTSVITGTHALRSGRIGVPIARLGLGLVNMAVARTNGASVGSVAVMVSIGEDAPVTTFDELLDALRYFATEAELQTLRVAPADRRPGLWAAFMRQSDPNPSTSENEALHEYFRRIAVANAQFRDDARPAWLSDRGSVVVALGEPDAISEPLPLDSTSTTRLVTWEYRRHRLLLVFSDKAGFGRWQLTPASEVQLRSLLSVAGPCVGCR